jgi:hypothetical protein
MALVSKLATKAMKKPAFKNVRSMVEAKAAARKEASTFKTIDQLKKEAIAAKPSTTKAVAPSSSKAARRQKAETMLLAATGSMFTAGAAYENAKQKKGAPTAEAKGRRGGRTGSAYTASPAESKVSVTPAKFRSAAPKTTDGNTTAPTPKAKQKLGGREVKNDKVFVSKAELDAFQKKYGTDKTLTDLLNAERGLTRRDAPAKKATTKGLIISEKPLKKLETQADVDKRRDKQEALQEKARRETT